MSRRTIALIVPKGWQLTLAWMLLVTYVVTSLAGLPAAFAAPELLGFRSEDVGPQLTREQQFTKSLKAENLREWMEYFTSQPHHVGSPHGKRVAEFMAERFREWGFDAELSVYHVLFPTPKLRKLTLLEPTRFEASLVEPGVPEDPTSLLGAREGLPPYNAFSADGDVQGELVYVNYGIPKDYEELDRRGINVSGRVVIARYGGSWRGIKPKLAAEKGAIGCILYSDPIDDGYFQGDDYPRGPFKNDRGVQRGSVVDLPVRPGDPLTPNIGATADAPRLRREQSETLMKIPVLPISYSDALPLLKALDGPVAPEAWRGALPLTYHLGPGPAKVRLHLEFNWDLVPAYNVIAKLEGREWPDQWIIRGNHHDAWVIGADDPTAGMVALMEEARAVSELVRQGWRPRRTLVYCGWDAEEPGLLGSVEWVEHHFAELKKKVAVYINTDSNGRGFLRMRGSHSLEKFINSVGRDVKDPQTGVSVVERHLSRLLVQADQAERRRLYERDDVRIGALGSGSDYTPFLQHVGISVLNLDYGGENRGGEYHTLYDTFENYLRFGDPEFAYGVTLAETCGRLTLRLSECDVLPFAFNNLAETVGGYVDEVIELVDALRAQTEMTNRLIRENRFKLTADPKQAYFPPKSQAPVPHVAFAPLLNARTRLKTSAAAYAAARGDYFAAKQSLNSAGLSELNRILFQAERVFLRTEGLPHRPWFRHQIYAPGLYTGYGVKTLPAVREALESRDWQEAEKHIVLVGETIEKYAAQIDRATGILTKSR